MFFLREKAVSLMMAVVKTRVVKSMPREKNHEGRSIMVMRKRNVSVRSMMPML